MLPISIISRVLYPTMWEEEEEEAEVEVLVRGATLKSDMHPSISPLRKTLKDLMFPWLSFPEDYLWIWATPLTTSATIFTLVTQSNGTLFAPPLPPSINSYTNYITTINTTLSNPQKHTHSIEIQIYLLSIMENNK